ncbi:hypothetical protein M3765_10765 [Streptomyces thermoviolaceus]|uniref:hypothetical protein n=1 Tax=Streptomyces thermoviolaceus TaxID=1952 RepID=UPI0020417CF6|nr:hypothetical protein [Streptomyces thermoviolaceus]MCM3264507.1 hypothetical protein [Streptomyces thermoviolaceus]
MSEDGETLLCTDGDPWDGDARDDDPWDGDPWNGDPWDGGVDGAAAPEASVDAVRSGTDGEGVVLEDVSRSEV